MDRIQDAKDGSWHISSQGIEAMNATEFRCLSFPVALALISTLTIACGSPSSANSARNGDTAVQPHPSPGPSAMKAPEAVMITAFAQLPASDGEKVTVAGTYYLYDPVPHLKRNPPFYLSAILFEGETRPRLFLQQPRPADEQAQMNGRAVRVTGIFHRTQPRHPNDPPHSATFSGSWLYDITALEPIPVQSE